jgi:hypothetical protein
MARLLASCWAVVMCKRSRVRAVAGFRRSPGGTHCTLQDHPLARCQGERHRVDCGESLRSGRPVSRARHQLPLLPMSGRAHRGYAGDPDLPM